MERAVGAQRSRTPSVKKPTMGSSSNPAHKAGVPRTDIVWGINRGHPTNRRILAPRRVHQKGVASERVKTIRSVIREVTGFAPYERRAMELIRNSRVCGTVWPVACRFIASSCVWLCKRDANKFRTSVRVSSLSAVSARSAVLSGMY